MDEIEAFNKLVEAHQRKRIKAEDKATLELLQLLERSRKRTSARLLDAGDGSRAHLAALLKEIDKTIDELSDKLEAEAREAFSGSYRMGIATAIAEIRIFEPDLRIVVPAVPVRVIEILHEKNIDHLQALTDQLRRDAKAEIEMGVIEGRPYADIIRRVSAPEGSLFRVPYASAMRTVRQTVGESYNQARLETIKRTAKHVPGMGKAWLSRLKDSTSICTELHGQKVAANEMFDWRDGRWRGHQPWAVWQDADPKYHVCHSVIVPWAPHWPRNPKLEPITREGRKAQASQVVDLLRSGKVKEVSVARLDPDLAKNIGAKVRNVMLSRATLEKNLAHHPELPERIYNSIPEVLDKAHLVVQDGARSLVFFKYEERLVHMALKSTQSGKGVFVTSIRYTDEKDVERVKRRGKVIREK
ncbi:hypothetical protein D3C86_1092030 [compost metagenome]